MSYDKTPETTARSEPTEPVPISGQTAEVPVERTASGSGPRTSSPATAEADARPPGNASSGSISRPGPTPSHEAAGEPATIERPIRGGVNWLSVAIGLICLIVSALVVLGQRVDLRIDWQQYGPTMLIGVGAVLVVLGGIGLVRRQR